MTTAEMHTGGEQRHPFGETLRRLRLCCGLSQNMLARGACVDPAYVNRLERVGARGAHVPSRRVILALYEALLTAAEEVGAHINHHDRERLLVAAGLCPEVIVGAGGWDGYRLSLHQAIDATLGKVDAEGGEASGAQ